MKGTQGTHSSRQCKGIEALALPGLGREEVEDAPPSLRPTRSGRRETGCVFSTVGTCSRIRKTPKETPPLKKGW